MRVRALSVTSVLLLLLAGCEASCSMSTARISQPAVAAAVDPVSREPMEPRTVFPSSTGTLHAAVRLEYAPADTRVAAVFHFLEGEERQIAADEVVAEGSRWIAFELSPPEGGWPAGSYRVRFLLDGEKQQQVEFVVTASGTPVADSVAPATGPVPSTPSPSWRRFADDKLGFAIEVPEDWGYRLLDSGSYILEGPRGTPAYEMSVIVQIIQRAADPGSSKEAQLAEARAGVLQAPGAELVNQDSMTVAGQPAPFFSARYSARDSTGATRDFVHVQYVVESELYWFWVSVSGPSEIFQSLAGEMDHTLQSFALLK